MGPFHTLIVLGLSRIIVVKPQTIVKLQIHPYRRVLNSSKSFIKLSKMAIVSAFPRGGFGSL